MIIDVAVFSQDILVRQGSVVCAWDYCFRIVADSLSGQRAQDLLSIVRPDVLLLDVSLPNCSPEELAMWCRRNLAKTRVVFYFDRTCPDVLPQLDELACHGLLWKGASIVETFHALIVAHQGGLYLQGVGHLSSEVMEDLRMQRDPVVLGGEPTLVHSSITRILTHREQEIADLLALGMTNKEIAAQLHISENTLKTHISRIYKKTGLKRRRDWTQRVRAL